MSMDHSSPAFRSMLQSDTVSVPRLVYQSRMEEMEIAKLAERAISASTRARNELDVKEKGNYNFHFYVVLL